MTSEQELWIEIILAEGQKALRKPDARSCRCVSTASASDSRRPARQRPARRSEYARKTSVNAPVIKAFP